MTKATRRAVTATACAFALLVGLVSPLGSTPDAAVAAAADIPPTPIYQEDFQNTTTGVPLPLTSYAGSGGNTYTAAPYWLTAGYCNGFVTKATIHPDNDQIENTWCGWNRSAYGQGWNGTGAPRGDYDAVRAKAFALGVLRNDITPASNYALSTNTSGGVPSTNWSSTESIMFRTSGADIELPSERFISFSVDAASTNEANDARMRFEYVRDGQTVVLPSRSGETPNPEGVITPWTSPGGTVTDFKDSMPWPPNTPDTAKPTWVTNVAYGTFYSGTFQSGTSDSPIQLILRNTGSASSTGRGIGNNPATGQGGSGDQWFTQNGRCAPMAGSCVGGSADGNDGAIDNIEILDVTPKMSKAFNPVRVPVGGESIMTLTIKNRADLNEKDGWSFVDTLPEGLEFKNATVGGTCVPMGKPAGGGKPVTSFTVDVSAGTLAATRGVLAAGAEECTITTTVTSTDAQTFHNGPTAYHHDKTPKSPDVDVQDPAEVTDEDRNDPARTFNEWHYIDPPNDAHVTFYPWIKLQKDVVSRVNSTDQFKLDITGPTPALDGQVTSGSKTTTSTNNGVQTPVVGEPEFIELVPGKEYTLAEVGAGNPAANLDVYDSSLSCVTESDSTTELLDDGPISATSGTLEAPGVVTGNSVNIEPVGHENVICTFTNEPAKTQVTITKRVQDSTGENEAPREGWTVGMSAAATSGSATATPSDATQQTGESGSASWEIAHSGSNPTVTVTVSETQQDDFTFVSGECTVTPKTGEPKDTELMSAAAQSITGVKPGDKVDCTYVNKLKPATVTIGKKLQSDNDQLTPAAGWIVGATLEDTTASGVTITTPTTAETKRTPDTPATDGYVETPWTINFAHTVTNPAADVRVEETMQAGYRFVRAECVITGRGDRTVAVTSASEVLEGLKPGENARCGFVNTVREAPALPLTGGLGSDFFTLLGLGVLTLGAGAAAVITIRQRRQGLVQASELAV